MKTGILYAAAAIGLVIVNWLCVATMLVEMGLATTGAAAAMFAAPAVVLGVALKTLGDWLNTRARRRYVGCLTVAAVVAGLTWLALFAMLYADQGVLAIPIIECSPALELNALMAGAGLVVGPTGGAALWFASERAFKERV